MKKSEQLELEAHQAESDSSALGIFTKAMREKRAENFEEFWLEKLQRDYKCEEVSEGKFTIYDTKFGTLDFFPKVNKVLIRKQAKWKKPGLKWMVNNIL